MRIPIQLLYPDAKPPVYGSDGAAAFDVHAYLKPWPGKTEPAPYMNLVGGQHAFIGVGFALAVPEGWVALLNIRSGLGAKKGLRLRNTIGYIDPDFGGQLTVVLENSNAFQTHRIEHGERIAQCIIVPAPRVTFDIVETLPTTKRGAGGFGSTGRGHDDIDPRFAAAHYQDGRDLVKHHPV